MGGFFEKHSLESLLNSIQIKHILVSIFGARTWSGPGETQVMIHGPCLEEQPVQSRVEQRSPASAMVTLVTLCLL